MCLIGQLAPSVGQEVCVCVCVAENPIIHWIIKPGRVYVEVKLSVEMVLSEGGVLWCYGGAGDGAVGIL